MELKFERHLLNFNHRNLKERFGFITDYLCFVLDILFRIESLSMETSEYKTWFVIGEPFKLPSRYQVLDHFGSGTFGVVCAAEDRRTKEIVAIKKCKNVFQSVTMAKRTLREIRLLRLLKHEHIIDLMTLIKPENLDNFTDIYSVFEILETDLAQIIHSPQMLQPAHVQYFTFQLVNGLNFLHSARVVHRDIK